MTDKLNNGHRWRNPDMTNGISQFLSARCPKIKENEVSKQIQCPDCDGTGKYTIGISQPDSWLLATEDRQCHRCRGEGKIIIQCEECSKLQQENERLRELLKKYLDMTKLAYGTYASEIHNSSIAKLIEETEKALKE